jgi:outer membrane protein OmpA-like peptidoglycan-associated protein
MNWRIEGHTDIEESENLMVRSLSLRRAEAILNYFVSKGLPSYQFRVYDMGDKFPIANNNTEYGRMKNRRVVLVREN